MDIKHPMFKKSDAASRKTVRHSSSELSPKMSREEYNKLKRSGMMWEFFPDFTGDYEIDIEKEK